MTKLFPLFVLLLLWGCGSTLQSSLNGEAIKLSSKKIIQPSTELGHCLEDEAETAVLQTLENADEELAIRIVHEKIVKDELWPFQLSQLPAAGITIQLSIYDEEGYALICPYTLNISSENYLNALSIKDLDLGVGRYWVKFTEPTSAKAKTVPLELLE